MFILDALDELTPVVTREIAQNNLDYTIELSSTCPTILTSRFTYVERNIPKRLVSYENSIHILDFTDEKIDRFLKLKFNQSESQISDIKKKIENESLKSIVRKPLFLNILSEKFETLKNISYINEAVLFRILTDEWITHDILKKTISEPEKNKKIDERQRCSEILAIGEYRSGNPITLEDITELVKEEFQYDHADIADNLEQYYRDARDATFLSVESDDAYRFILRPFLEFFVASRIIRDIVSFEQKQHMNNIVLNLSPEIRSFIKSIIEVDWLIDPILFDQITEHHEQYPVDADLDQKLISKIDYRKNLKSMINKYKDDVSTNLSNPVRVLCDSHLLQETPDLSNLNLQQIDLSGISIIRGIFRNSNLSGGIFSVFHGISCIFIFANLQYAKIENANFTKSLFNNANLSNSAGNNINFVETNFQNTIVNSADYSLANFSRANLSKSSFNGAKLEKCTFLDASLNDVDFTEADLSDSYLAGLQLSGVVLTNCDLSHAYLYGSNLSRSSYLGTIFDNGDLENVSFKETNLTSCSLEKCNLTNVDFQEGVYKKVNFSGSIFKNSKLNGSKFIECNFTDADLSGVDFTKSELTSCVFTDAKTSGSTGLYLR